MVKTYLQGYSGRCMSSIREYRQEDSLALEECIIEMQEHEKRIEPNRREGKGISKQYLRKIIETCIKQDGKIFVAEENGDVMGYVCVWIERQPEELISTLTEYAYISDVIVMPPYRGKGIAKTLLEAAEQHATLCGMKTITLNVLTKNDHAIEMYKKIGFKDYEMRLKKQI